MHFTAAAAAAILATTVSARSAVTLNESCDTNKPHAKVINRCPYEVNIWSVFKGDGCPGDQMVTLQPGETYNENYADAEGGSTGISIKISKTKECKGNPITQLEYFLQSNSPGFNYNYLDVSYVDCASNDDDCPTRQEGYYLAAGDSQARAMATSNDEWCPRMACWDACSCNMISYVQPDDVQTKTCQPDQNMEFYMCGSEGPDQSSGSTATVADFTVSSLLKKMQAACPMPAGSSKEAAKPSTTLQKQTSAAQPSTTAAAKETYEAEADIKVNAAAVTPAPQAEQLEANLKTKTEVVYVTAYETVNAKRHAHGHARRHAAYHA